MNFGHSKNRRSILTDDELRYFDQSIDWQQPDGLATVVDDDASSRPPPAVLSTADARPTALLRRFGDSDENRSRPLLYRVFIGVGINYVGQPKNRLRSCWRDVNVVHDTLGPFDARFVLTDHADSCGIESNWVDPEYRLPTFQNFRRMWIQIFQLIQTVTDRPIDMVFVFSGHGTFKKSTDPYELYGQSDCMVLLDGFVWDYDIVRSIIRRLPPHLHMWMIFDSCNSGTAANLPFTYDTVSGRSIRSSEHVDLGERSSIVVLLSGCRDEQTANAGLTSSEMSALTRSLVTILRDLPKPVWHQLTLAELLNRIQREMDRRMETQTPQLSSTHRCAPELRILESQRA